jgi:hypothetical protein
MNKIEKKITIECGFEEACLIERALDLYSRVGILQFEYLTGCTSLQRVIWDKDISDEFRKKADALKSTFGYEPNAHPGIFNTEDVHDDVRVAADLYQSIRHERYKDRIRTGEQTKSHHTVDEYPADICNIGGMPIPNFKVKIEENGKEEYRGL